MDSAQVAGENLSGQWLSRYSYYSSGRDEELRGEHTVRLRHTGGQIIGTSEPVEHESRLVLELNLRGAIATGTWTERTSPVGYYQGAVYHGAIQLAVGPHRRTMSGRWLGFGKQFEVNTGDWHLEWLDD